MSTIEEGNKVISEFMGETYAVEYDSWNWLIPVWIKLRDLEFDNAKLEVQHSHWRQIIGNEIFLAKSPIDFFNILHEAIIWYNQTQKK